MRGEPFIIAELSVNHGGDYKLARRMIQEAHSAGCDAVKFQYYHTEDLYPRKSRMYQRLKPCEIPLKRAGGPGRGGGPAGDLTRLKRCAELLDMWFIVTPFKYPFRIMECVEAGLRLIKIRETDSENIAMRSTAIAHADQVYISTQNPAGLKAWNKQGIAKTLYCCPLYPPAWKQIEFEKIKDASGYSNHYPDVKALDEAVKHGAKILEVHVKLSEHHDCLDKAVSLTFAEVKQWVDARN